MSKKETGAELIRAAQKEHKPDCRLGQLLGVMADMAELEASAGGCGAYKAFSGPAQIATRRYRDNYTSVFGDKVVGEA